jgi:hypothetical protein
VNLQAIEKLASRLRRALVDLPRADLPFSMFCFPKGACGDTSLLLGAYLVDSGIKDFHYICGERGSHEENTWTTHAWLAKGDLVVDITADQFSDAPAAVIVTTSSLWHKGFTTDVPAPADFREYSGFSISELAQLYARLRPALFSP